MSGLIVSLDLGSTSFKARVYDRELRPLGQAGVQIAYRHGDRGRVEIPSEEVDRAVSLVLADALSGSSGRDLEAISIASQAQTFTILDASDRPVAPFVSWMDSRSRLTAEELGADPAFADFAAHASFGAPIAGLAFCILAHLAREGGAPARGDRVAFLPSYVAEKLTGHRALDDNLAAMTGLYSMALGDWWPAALARCGLAPSQLPALCRVGSVVGTTTRQAADWGLPAGLAVLLAGNDQTAGAYGCGIHRDGSLLVTLGTAQVAYRVSPVVPASGPALFRGPYPGGLWYQAAVDEGGGSLVGWACSVLAGCQEPQRFFALASQAPAGARGVVYAPSRWEGITTAHGPADLARSVLEYLVAQVAMVVRRVEPDPAGRRILLAGGGSRQPLWLTLLSEALDARLSATDADPLLGAAHLGREALLAGATGPR